MLSAAFTDSFQAPASRPAASGNQTSLSVSTERDNIKREPCSDDEEIEVGKESDMDESSSPVPVPVQDPLDLSVKKEKKDDGASVSTSSSRPSSISPPTRSTESSSPDSQKNGETSRAKRIKPIPPPLDLNARTLSPTEIIQGSGHSPSAAAQDRERETLPLRKR